MASRSVRYKSLKTLDDGFIQEIEIGETQSTRWRSLRNICNKRRKDESPRVFSVGQMVGGRISPPNIVKNGKYNLVTFLPKVLFQQFKVFLNFYFLCIAMSQLVPQLKIGYWYTYWGPLMFVVCVTMARELLDDIKRHLRDKEVNSQKFSKLTKEGLFAIASSDIKVGDVLVIKKDQKIPADVILVKTTNKNGTCFIRTDQLDGETDWKVRIASPSCQSRASLDEDVLSLGISITVEAPKPDIYSFCGTLSISSQGLEDSLSVDNVVWCNSVLASSGSILGIVIYTGKDTRSVLNTSDPRTKDGRLDNEVNNTTKVLFLSLLVLSVFMLSLKGFTGPWFVYLIRYIILFSYVIPISLRVNLDMGKLLYSWIIQKDRAIPNTLVRTSTIPEELGRIEYIMSDKTGTLTKNDMIFKKVHFGFDSYSSSSSSEIRTTVVTHFSSCANFALRNKLVDGLLAIGICHNVTPVTEDNDQEEDEGEEDEQVLFIKNKKSTSVSYQSSSPDEIALVKWAESVGLSLVHRDLSSMHLLLPNGDLLKYRILLMFPFSSERKRMGIIVQNELTDEIVFYMKGADTVMEHIVEYSDWLHEECDNLAREGLRTLVVSKKVLTYQQYTSFESHYKEAQSNVTEREMATSRVLETLENSMELLCVTGVEDQLQEEVRPTLELLKNAGIKIWMLTGDKQETAVSIGISSKLIARNQPLFMFQSVSSRSEIHSELNKLRKKCDSPLVISGSSFELCIEHYQREFVELACQCPVIVCCRCSPKHKAKLVTLVKSYTKRPVCAIGDGGNDVSMIQMSDVGIGIVGKEGKQASLAADFSITHFSYVSRLLLWHGRNSYKRSASLSHFVIHRGLIISAMQAVFSALFYFAAISLYEGILMVGYATVYTMAPVFSLVLDEDVSPDVALTYPELYQELLKGRSFSLKTIFLWSLISIYQGGIIMLIGFWLFESQLVHVVAITFTSLILTELLMVALTIRTWHGLMVVAEITSIAIYVTSLAVLHQYFDGSFLLKLDFVWKTALLTLVSCVPLTIVKIGHRRCAPPSYAKLLKSNSAIRNIFKCTF